MQVVEISAATAQGKGRSQGEQKESPSVSIIQVYGKAEADSFKLATDYVALRGAPYRYNLRAYGPNSSHRQEKDKNKLAKEKIFIMEIFGISALKPNMFSALLVLLN